MTDYASPTATVGIETPSVWGSGFVANFTITAEQTISGWQIEIQFSGTIQNIWGARIVSHAGDTYVIEGLSWNSNINEGSTQGFGFVAAGSPDDIAPLSFNGDGFGDDADDIATFPGNRDDYSVTQIDEVTVEITGPEGTQVYSGIETFEFADLTQTFDELLVPRLANLEAGEITLTDISLAPEETATVSVEIASNGVIDASASSAELVVASDPNGTSIIGSYGSIDLGAITTGGSETASIEFDPGDLEPGTYWVAVRADSSSIVTEENESDNLSNWVEVTIEAPFADFILHEAGLGDRTDLDLEGGGRIEIDYVIENASNADTSYLRARTYLSSDMVISDDDRSIAGITGGTFPGHTTSVSTVHYFQEDFTPGDYYLISIVEWGDGRPDATPENNTLIQQITFIAPPEPVIDLSVTEIEILNSSDLDIGPDGGVLELSIGLVNLGEIQTGAGLSVILSTDATLSADDLALWNGSTDVDAGSVANLEVTATLEAGLAAGDYTVFVTASTDGDIDLANNIASTALQLTVPENPGTEGDDIWVSGDEPANIDLLGGNDIAIAGIQSDVVSGGNGYDIADFSQISEGLDLYLDSFAPQQSIRVSPLSTFTPTSYWSGFEEIIATDFDDQVLMLEAVSALVLDAGGGDDIVEDGEGDDSVDLGAGNDVHFTWLGDDVITTGSGSDAVAVLRDPDGTFLDLETGPAGVGHDVITDFNVDDDMIFILQNGSNDYDPFADLTQTDDGVLLSYADDSSLLLEGVMLDELSEANISVEPDGIFAISG